MNFVSRTHLLLLKDNVATKWLPTDIAGCVLWLRSDLAWQDAAKTVPCTNSTLVYTGEDKSGSGNDVIQATETKRPTYLTNQINGHPCWRFDGNDDMLVSGDAFSWPHPNVIYIVFKQITWTVVDFVYDAVLVDAGMGLFQNIASPNLYIHNGVPVLMEDPLAIGTWGAVKCVFTGGADSSIRLNMGTPTVGNAGNFSPGGFRLGRLGNTDIFYGNIDVAEVIGYGAVPSLEDDALIMNYLNTLAQGTGYAIY